MLKRIAALVIGITVLTGLAMALSLNGAGATFPYPIYSKWFSLYKDQAGVAINYSPIGSGGGIRQFSAGVVDFGATDAFLTDKQIEDAGGDVVHIPTVMGAVAVVYNVSGLRGLKLDGPTLAGIYLGEIKKWNDPKIAALNSGLSLPDQDILVAHRSDGSGTSNIFTGYLVKVSTKWAAQVGQGTSVAWPVGVGGKGNAGVAGAVQNNEGSIGYVELAYAETNHLAMADLKNLAGNFVPPSIDGTIAAAAGASKNMPSDFRAEINNQPGRATYPICGFTWIILHRNQASAEKGEALKAFLKWAATEGQRYAGDLYYASLPEAVRDKVLVTIGEISTK